MSTESIALSSETDLAALARLHAACFAEPWSAQALRDLLATPGTFGFVLPDGFGLARVAVDEAEILTLAVAPEARRRGIGAALLTALGHQANQLGAGTVVLEVGAANPAARALYALFGFAPVGARKAYYGALDGDALILRAELPFPPWPLGKTFSSTNVTWGPRGEDRDAD